MFVRKVLVCSCVAGALAAASCGSDDGSSPTSSADAGSDAPPNDGAPPVDAPHDAPPLTAEYKSGTRLRPYVRVGGTTKLFDRWRDTKLDVDCYFDVLTTNETPRCRPETSGWVFFADDKCTQRVVAWTSECVPPVAPKYAQYTDPTKPCATLEIVEIGAALPATTAFELGSDGKCTAWASGPLTLRAVSRTVAPSELVSATITKEPRGKQLLRSYLDGEDGSRQPWRIEDSAPHAGPCYDQHTTDGELRCIPAYGAFANDFFSDPTCTTKRAGLKSGFTPTECSYPAKVVFEYDANACRASATLSEVGPTEPGPVYEGTPAACNVQPFSAASGFTFYDIGAPIPSTSFAKLKHVPTTSTPLGIDTLAVESGEVVQAYDFWDPVHTTACVRSKAADGKLRCLPQVGGGTPWFADAACKTPLAGVQHPSGCATPAVPKHVLVLTPGTCTDPEGPTHVHKVGAKVTPATVYFDCTPMPPPADMDFYETTGEVPASELVEITELLE
jgi:hypothetical protein